MVKKLMMKKSKKGSDPKKSKLLKIQTKKINELGISYEDMANIVVKATDYLINKISPEDLELIQTNFVSLKTVGELHNNLQRMYENTRNVLNTFINSESLYLTKKQIKLSKFIMGIDILDAQSNICQHVEKFNGQNNYHVYTEVKYIPLAIGGDRTHVITTLSTNTIEKLAEARIRTETRYLIATSVDPTFESNNHATLEELNSSKMLHSDQITNVKRLQDEMKEPEIIDASKGIFGCAARYDENSPTKSWYVAATIKKLRDLVTSKSKAVITAVFPVFTGTMLAALTEFINTGSVSPETFFNSTWTAINLTMTSGLLANYTMIRSNDTMMRVLFYPNITLS